MKKLVLIVFVIALFGGVTYAAEGDGPGQGVFTVRERYDYVNITTATDTVVKASPGMVAGILVSGGTMGAITVYDNPTCATYKIATIASPVAGQVIPFGVNTARGLCITTGAAMDLTVVYK